MLVARMSFLRSFHAPLSCSQTPELILRCYGVVFGVFIVLVELELPFVLSHAAFMDSWVARGLCIAFVVRHQRECLAA